MRHRIKSIGMAFLMLFAVLAMTACGSSKEETKETVSESIVEQLKASEDNILMTLSEMSDEEIAAYLASGDEFTISAMNAWKDNKDDLGAYLGINDAKVTLDDDNYLVSCDAAFEKANATVSMNVDAQTGVPTYLSMEVQYSLGKLMGQAGMNTLMGVGIVFLILLLLSGLISLFKYVGRIGIKPEKAAPVPAAPAPAVPAVEEELVDDTELVAVIAAAIAASENTSTDSFVVRSIRRKPNNKWQRA